MENKEVKILEKPKIEIVHFAETDIISGSGNPPLPTTPKVKVNW